MAEDAVDKRIDEGTVEAFESVCGVLGHNITGQFSIFDGAWQVVKLAILDAGKVDDLSPAACAQLRDELAEITPVLESVMQIGQEIRSLLFPQTRSNLGFDFQSDREINRARWSPYDRAAWNAFFAGVQDHIEQVFVLLDQIDDHVANLRELRIELALNSFDHFEPMLAANLRERLVLVIETYRL